MLDVEFFMSFDGLRIFSGCSDGLCGPGWSLGYSDGVICGPDHLGT